MQDLRRYLSSPTPNCLPSSPPNIPLKTKMALQSLSHLNWKTSWSAIPKIRQKHGHWHEIFTAVRWKKKKKASLDLVGRGMMQLHKQERSALPQHCSLFWNANMQLSHKLDPGVVFSCFLPSPLYPITDLVPSSPWLDSISGVCALLAYGMPSTVQCLVSHCRLTQPPPSLVFLHPPSPSLQWLLTLQQSRFKGPSRSSPYLHLQFYPLPSPEPPPSPPCPIPPETRRMCVYFHAVGHAFLSARLSQSWHTLLLILQCSAFLVFIISGLPQLG